MEPKVASTRMYSLMVLYGMHTDFFGRVLDGISDEDAQTRLNNKVNNVCWIAGSLVQERFELARELGIDRKQSADELFKDHKGIQDGVTYPPLETFKKDWESIAPLLKDALTNASDERLDKPFNMGPEQMTFFDLIAFIMHREAYCIGQIGLLRRLLGYEAMKYQ